MTRVMSVVMLLVAALAAPLAAETQEAGRIHRIGVLGTSDGSGWQAFRDGLQSLGYLEGRTIAVDWRWAGNDAGRFTDLAADLVRQQVDLIVTGADPAPAAARSAPRPPRSSWSARAIRSPLAWWRAWLDLAATSRA